MLRRDVHTRVYTAVQQDALNLEVQTMITGGEEYSFAVFAETVGIFAIKPDAVDYFRQEVCVKTAQTIMDLAEEDRRIARLMHALCILSARDFDGMRAWLIDQIPHEGMNLDALVVYALRRVRETAAPQAA